MIECITFLITTNCNMKCSYCYEEGVVYSDMSEDTIIDTIRYIDGKTYDKVHINIHGGEPTLYVGKIEFLINELEKYGKEKNVKFTYSMTTNGTSNSEKLLYLIKKFDIDLSISVDGRFETQNENRPLKNGKSSFHIVSNFIDKILSMDISPRIRMTYNSKDVKYIFKNVSFLIEKGLECIVAHHNSYDPDWSYEHVDELKKQIQMLKARYGDKENLLINLTKEISNMCKGKCSCGESELVVFTNGDLYTCTWCAGDGEHIIGNVREGICREKLDYYRNIANSKNIECEGCAIYDLCENVRCKFINKSRSGFYDRVLPIDCLIKNSIVECNGVMDN